MSRLLSIPSYWVFMVGMVLAYSTGSVAISDRLNSSLHSAASVGDPVVIIYSVVGVALVVGSTLVLVALRLPEQQLRRCCYVGALATWGLAAIVTHVIGVALVVATVPAMLVTYVLDLSTSTLDGSAAIVIAAFVASYIVLTACAFMVLSRRSVPGRWHTTIYILLLATVFSSLSECSRGFY
ncbi:MAG: hypothetical protein AB7O68_14550 [Pirellulales bacterium]